MNTIRPVSGIMLEAAPIVVNYSATEDPYTLETFVRVFGLRFSRETEQGVALLAMHGHDLSTVWHRNEKLA